MVSWTQLDQVTPEHETLLLDRERGFDSQVQHLVAEQKQISP